MHDFHYQDGELYCESVRVQDIAERVGTPFYLYSHKTFTEHLAKIQSAFRSLKPLICFSMKANSNLAVLRSLVKKGAGLDIVSSGELFRAKKAGCPPSKIVYAGVGKTDLEIEEAIRAGILLFNVESIQELGRIQKIAKKLRKKANVSLRINPDVDPGTHAHITTGKAESKFGLDMDTAHLIFMRSDQYPHLSICGVHVHIGSQIVKGEPFVKAFRKVLLFLTHLEKEGHRIKYLNLGGGLGIIYSDERPQTAEQFAKHVLPLFRSKKYKIIFEPGRFIAGNSGIFVSRVIYIKRTKAKNFAIIDGGMNDLIRPALYDSFHDIWPLHQNGTAKRLTYDVVGPICESGDFLAKQRTIQELKPGDLIAFASAGAYGFSMSSNYNARPRVAEVLVRGSRFEIVRQRETYKDLIRGERIPSWV
ncbi:MAG: diaminopimelate decarboxylase [Omnitrophica bacterium RIFCSPHIGHO2_02_FULL_46_11]|nr:MAG: diaminopimelate decarboxylase [Omnitrophica bacterium RIFCSPHIGHO2_02_FULL_46_11]OGW87599.1 MAG: diaminopimelate decarboxylase [Omnitrophica bacterium RIFCSPLOWO2_01_FULL_45_10b]